jgi:hypothetical protein
MVVTLTVDVAAVSPVKFISGHVSPSDKQPKSPNPTKYGASGPTGLQPVTRRVQYNGEIQLSTAVTSCDARPGYVLVIYYNAQLSLSVLFALIMQAVYTIHRENFFTQPEHAKSLYERGTLFALL